MKCSANSGRDNGLARLVNDTRLADAIPLKELHGFIKNSKLRKAGRNYRPESRV